MKAIRIDVVSHSVYEVDVDPGLDAIYQQVACSLVTVPVTFPNEDALYVDDEALLKPFADIPGGFVLDSFGHQMLFGHGLILGTDDEGESVSVKSSVEEIRRQVTFITDRDHLQRGYDYYAGRPPQIFFW